MSAEAERGTTKCGRCGADVEEIHVTMIGDKIGANGENSICFYSFRCQSCKKFIEAGETDVDGTYSTTFYAHLDEWQKYSRDCNCSKIEIVPAYKFENCNCAKHIGHWKTCPAYDPNFKPATIEVGVGGCTSIQAPVDSKTSDIANPADVARREFEVAAKKSKGGWGK